MVGYRLYILNTLGHIVDAVEFFGDDDEEAEAIAQQCSEGRSTELWSGARVIRKYEELRHDRNGAGEDRPPGI